MVANVDQYQHFVPWCRKSRYIKRKTGDIQAELEIGFLPLVERYTSDITFIPNRKIRVSKQKLESSYLGISTWDVNEEFLLSFFLLIYNRLCALMEASSDTLRLCGTLPPVRTTPRPAMCSSR